VRRAVMTWTELAVGSFVIALSACGGGGSGGIGPASYNLQAGYVNLINTGLTADVNLSGTIVVNGTSAAITGTGSVDLSPGVATTFNNSQALSQTETATGTVTADGQSAPFTSSQDDFYAPGSGAVLGQSDTGEYDVAQTPFTYPSSVMGGSSGNLGTLSRYTDSTMGVSLGTAQVSYAVSGAQSAGGPVAVQVTTQIYDTQNTLSETDVTVYSLTSASVLSFVSSSAQTSSSSLTLTAQ
jgi:hypothetical protein